VEAEGEKKTVYKLISGYRRLEAVKRLGWKEIEGRLYENLSEFERKSVELEEELAQKKARTWQEEVAIKRKLHELFMLVIHVLDLDVSYRAQCDGEFNDCTRVKCVDMEPYRLFITDDEYGFPMTFNEAIKGGFRVVNRNWQLVLIQLSMVFISSIGFFIIVGIPLAVAFIIFGVDLTEMASLHDIAKILKEEGFIKKAMVIGGGIAGIQASLDLAEAGARVCWSSVSRPSAA
jgi:hypothetical protein